jgi:thioredoxin reductase (NADPH)
MSKPVILAIDDDPSVLETITQDLRRRYRDRYRVLRAASGKEALELCEQLQQRGDTVALFLSDQRMPGMSGTELLERTRALFPEAKRALLTAYADTESAIRAINNAKIQYYLTKPWDPPEERLYPAIDDLLETWADTFRAPFQGLTVIGLRYGQRDAAVRDFLTRNFISYRWLDPDRNREAAELLQRRGLDEHKLPVLLFEDGSYMQQPDTADLAARIGWKTEPAREFYDLAILGAGLAGLAAAVYGASEGLRTLIIETGVPGGQAGSSSRIENYLGFPTGVSGAELASKAHQQAIRLGAEFLAQRAQALRSSDDYRFIRLADGREVPSRCCLLATGVHYRRLAVPGLDRLTGLGVYYGAALSEVRSCEGEDIYIVGGANSAGQAAMAFSACARRVIMLVRGSSLENSMSKYLIDQIAGESNIELWTESEVLEALGNEHLECLRIRTPEGQRTVPANGLFIFIGAAPKTEWLPPSILRDQHGFVLSGPYLKSDPRFSKIWTLKRDPLLLETSEPGVFAAGDVRHGSVKRAASAVGEGSIAVQFIHQYLAQF